MSGKTWQIQPVYGTVIEILKEKGSIADTELFEILKAFYKEIGFDDLNKTLMGMEINRLVSVSTLSKNRRLVELKKNR
jgi:hypothetical protein